MSSTTPIPTISFENDLGYDIIVYDSFGDDETDSDSNTDDNYFGTLTSLGTVAAKTTTAIQPIHNTSAFVLENASTKKPVKRCTKLGTQKTITSFVISQDDEDAMTATFSFLDFYLKNPDDGMSKAFTAILNGDADSLESDITDFFPQYPAYAKCTFPDYMMAITYAAMNPPPAPTPSQPDPPPTWSLEKLAVSMGAKWPDGLPDITVSKFSCTNKDSVIFITADIDITTFSFESAAVAGNISTLVGIDKHFTVTIQFNYSFGLGIFGTRLSFLPDSFTIPAGGSNSIPVTKPSITFDINPLFKFVVFTAKGIIPFNLDNRQFDAEISLAVDNDEAAIGVTIDGDNSSFPAPPGLKGLFFDEFGLGIGLFFEPLSCIVGVQGKFHIGTTGNGNTVSLDDDTFALVCKITGEAVTPAFASFYTPKLDLNTVIELFTNASINLDVPVSFEDLSFRWVDSLMSAYVLPDGTLTNSGYGFSAACNVGSFGFYGDVELDLNNGLTANIEVSPVSWGNVLKLTGDGKGFSIKVDANSNPIKNNFVPTTQAEKDAVANAKDKVITTPGGPCLIINTLSLPILHLNAQASLFDLINYDIAADIDKDGIKFELDFGTVLTEKMVCNLTDFHNFYGEFGYYIDKSIPLPAVGGVSPGSVPLKADASLHLSITTSLTDVVISTGGQFDFEGYHFSFGDFSADLNISKIADFVAAIVQYIVDEAKTIFSQLIDTADHWAAAAAKGIITGFDDAGKVMSTVFGKTKEDAAQILKTAGFALNDIASALKNGYNASGDVVTSILRNLGYTSDQVAGAVKYAFSCAINDVCWCLTYVGYGIGDITTGLKSAFNATEQDIAIAEKAMSHAVNDIALSIKTVFNCGSQDLTAALKAAGYTAEEVAGAVKYTWNCAINDVCWAMTYVGYGINDITSGLKSAFNASEQDVAIAEKAMSHALNDIASGIKTVFNCGSEVLAPALRAAGYTAEQVAGAVKYAWNCGINDVCWCMTYVGYGVDDIASGLKSAFNATEQDTAAALKAMNHAVNDIAQALHDVYNAASQDVATVLKNLGYAASDVANAMKQVGYAADDVKNAFESLGGDFKSFADTAWGDIKNVFNPSNW